MSLATNPAVVALSVLLFMGCTSRADQPLPGEMLDTSGCETAPDWLACARERERSVVAPDDRVARIDDSLVIRPRRGPPGVLADSLDADGVGYRYLYLGFLPSLDMHLVQQQFYEGRQFLLVAATSGRVEAIDAAPAVAPDASRLVTASWDTEAGYDPNRLRVYRVHRDSLVLEFELTPELWGPHDAQWLDDSTIRLRRGPAIGHPDSTQLRAPLILRRHADKWSVDSVPSQF